MWPTTLAGASRRSGGFAWEHDPELKQSIEDFWKQSRGDEQTLTENLAALGPAGRAARTPDSPWQWSEKPGTPQPASQPRPASSVIRSASRA